MKKYSNTKNLLLVVIILVVSACNGIFIPDPINPRIPKYTEEGNNVSGALVDNNIWKSVEQWGFYEITDMPDITVWPENDSLSLRFTGSIDEENPSSIEFHMKGLKIDKFADLTTLNGKKIQLDGIKTAGYFLNDSSTDSIKGVGQIYFRNVKTEDSPTSIILSGTFSFSVHRSDGKILNVTSGRFDYQITESSNFIAMEQLPY